MAVRNIDNIINTNTFGQWIERTNEVIDSLDQVVTMGTDAVAQNDGQLYIQGNITTEAAIITDTISPLDGAADKLEITAGLTQVDLLALNVPFTGNNSAIQFTYNPAAASADTWRLGPTNEHGTFQIAGRNFISDSEIYDATLEITRATAPSDDADPTPGIITGTNIEIDDAILPAFLAFSNAASAAKWETARSVTFEDQNGGVTPTDVTGTFTLDGTGDISTQLQVVNDSHTHDLRYYTQTYIDTNYATLSTSNDTFIKVAPEDADDRSVVTAHGFVMQDDVALVFGTSEDMTMQFDGSDFEMRQIVNDTILTCPSEIRFKQFKATGLDVDRITFDMTNGNIVAEGDITAFGNASDIKLKENIEPITDALSKVSQLNGITFNYINKPDIRVPGLIAQELQEVLPEAVYEEEDALAVRYGNTIALLVEAIKELKAEVETLKAGS